MEECEEDLYQVKSVLTFLGYMTKTSIASIKTTKGIEKLESEYTKLRSNKSKEIFERFPGLESVDAFTPGIKSIILDITNYVNRKLIKKDFGDEIKSIKIKVLHQLKKVFFRSI